MSKEEMNILLPWRCSGDKYKTCQYYDRLDYNDDYYVSTIYKSKKANNYMVYLSEGNGGVDLFSTLEEAKKYADEELIKLGYKLLGDKHMSLL